MSNVKALSPNNNIDNIPHMLRNLASEIELGQAVATTVFVVALADADAPPDIYQFGKEIGRLTELGAFTSVINRISQVELSND